ncbi:DnaC replication protein [Virgibacillus phasianinus]|uniref:DnaC replication protein n=1 Tax=Virgibacillus phasianinus TaxID=2017483 RepID=A0A220U0A4_9BACI|nr:ATP-binding protein [Virgibacillus phasianinus]ASK61386.1 DnaC replication protein [Virgibacillus phasianinus]
MESANKHMASPEQKMINTFICEGCNQEVEQKELIIPIGPRKGEKVIANYGCICEEIELAEQTKEACSRRKQRKLMNSFHYYSLINESLKQATLENYEPTSNELLKAKQIVTTYIDTFDGKQNMLFTGIYGTGKSHLSVSITKKLMEQGYECLFLSLPKLLTKIKQTYNKEGATEEELLSVIQRVDLLVLDDIGAEQQTEWSTSKLFEILDDRAGKATIYTTNLKSPELKKRVNERNFSRIMENTEVIVMNGSDYRRRDF